MNSMTINPVQRLRGEISVPGDKSISHRAVIFGALAQGETYIEGFLPGEDCLNTLAAFKALGVDIRQIDNQPDKLIINGKGLYGLAAPSTFMCGLNVGNSGTSMRLLSGILAGQKFVSGLDGDIYLRRRPMGRVILPLKKMGADIRGNQHDKYPPLFFFPVNSLRGINYQMPIASAQVKSALLLAGMYAAGKTSICEPVKSRDHTERMLKQFGAPIKVDNLSVSISRLDNNALCAQKITIPADISSAAFFIIAGLIVSDSEILIKNVGINPTRTGLLDVLIKMGADIEVLNKNDRQAEPATDILVKSSRLKGIEITSELVPRMIDEFPIFCIAASLAE